MQIMMLKLNRSLLFELTCCGMLFTRVSVEITTRVIDRNRNGLKPANFLDRAVIRHAYIKTSPSMWFLSCTMSIIVFLFRRIYIYIPLVRKLFLVKSEPFVW